MRDSSGGDVRDDTLDDLPAVEHPTTAMSEPVRGSEPEQVTTDLVDCRNCQAPNSPNRYLCGRCGADLQTGEAARPVEVVPSPAVGARPRRHTGTDDLEGRPVDRRWRLAGAIVGIGMVIGGALGAMVAFGLGPFSGGTDAANAAAVFDRGDYPARPEPLAVTSVAASTVQDAGSGRFDPSRLVDDDLATAWNSRGDVNPDGVGEVLEFEFAEPVWLAQIVFANGDQQDDDTFAANARAKRIEVTLDGGSTFIVNLIDQSGEQAVRLPVPRLTTTVRFEVLESYPGDTYDDLGLSEVGFNGFVANPDDAAVARGQT